MIQAGLLVYYTPKHFGLPVLTGPNSKDHNSIEFPVSLVIEVQNKRLLGAWYNRLGPGNFNVTGSKGVVFGLC